MPTIINHFVEQFADLRILRYRVPGFDTLPLLKKQYLYYLSQAALSGRDITWDQNNRYNLWFRSVLTEIHQACASTCSEMEAFIHFETYFKRVLFSGGFHHHYSTDKLKPSFSEEDLKALISFLSNEQVLICGGRSREKLFIALSTILFDANFDAKRVCQDPEKDILKHSANNFYLDVSQTQAEEFYKSKVVDNDPHPISFGLNSRLEKHGQTLVEQEWKVGGTYSEAITQIIFWLRKAESVTENAIQQKCIQLLCNFYQTGDLKLFDAYSIEWLNEKEGDVDFVNGFIEVYGDSLGYKGTWESLVNIKDEAETLKAAVISENAQWFENHSPIDDRYRKKAVSGVSMKVINAVMLGGDCYPASPLGINLPNAEWIREQYGSKSVSLENISHAYHQASLTSGVVEEFTFRQSDLQWHKKYGALADNLHTHLHECVGHGSGISLPGVKQDALKAYGSVIEEARADLFGLYFMADDKMLELNLVPHADVFKAQYNSYIRNGLMVQMARVQPGKTVEQAHMRNRQLICAWVLEKGAADNVVERIFANGKTYFIVNDYQKLRLLFGQLLTEIQYIKSTGDFDAAKVLVEKYGVQVNQTLHAEVLKRYAGLNVAPYSGFVNPVLKPITNNKGNITDVRIDYSEEYLEQMLRYGRDYQFITNFEVMPIY